MPQIWLMARLGFHTHLSVLVLAFGLAACAGGSAPQRFPQVPPQDVLENADSMAFRTADFASFRYAELPYPGDGGAHQIAVGDALALNLANAFPRTAEVRHLRLKQWYADCETTGTFTTTVVCTASAALRFQLYNRRQDMVIQLADIELGPQLAPEDPAFVVGAGRQTDALQAQVRLLIDRLARQFEDDLQPVLLAAQNRLAF